MENALWAGANNCRYRSFDDSIVSYYNNFLSWIFGSNLINSFQSSSSDFIIGLTLNGKFMIHNVKIYKGQGLFRWKNQ